MSSQHACSGAASGAATFGTNLRLRQCVVLPPCAAATAWCSVSSLCAPRLAASACASACARPEVGVRAAIAALVACCFTARAAPPPGAALASLRRNGFEASPPPPSASSPTTLSAGAARFTGAGAGTFAFAHEGSADPAPPLPGPAGARPARPTACASMCGACESERRLRVALMALARAEPGGGVAPPPPPPPLPPPPPPPPPAAAAAASPKAAGVMPIFAMSAARYAILASCPSRCAFSSPARSALRLRSSSRPSAAFCSASDSGPRGAACSSLPPTARFFASACKNGFRSIVEARTPARSSRFSVC